MSTRSPARLVVALSVAAVLAVFLLYTAVAGNSTPTITPSQVTHQKGQLSIVGKVVGPIKGNAHASGGLRFALVDPNSASSTRTIPVVYRGDSPPPLFAVGRSVVVTGTLAGGHLAGRDILTKCPSKYTSTSPSA